jgi:cytochrome c oxidase assembly protein Cox11
VILNSPFAVYFYAEGRNGLFVYLENRCFTCHKITANLKMPLPVVVWVDMNTRINFRKCH